MIDVLVGVRDWVFLLVFTAFVAVIIWQIWRRQNRTQAHQVRAKARGWLGRAWDRVTHFWGR